MRVTNIFLVAIVLVFAGLFGLAAWIVHRDGASHLRSSEIDAGTGHLSFSTLSPDGSFLAVLNSNRQINEKGAPELENQFMVYKVSSSQIVATLQIPNVPFDFHSWQSESSGLQFCNHGKYLLAWDRGDVVHVFDTQSWQERLSLHPFVDAATSHGAALNFMRSACAANGTIVVFVLTATSPHSTVRTTRAYDLDSGQQLTDRAEDAGEDLLDHLAVSPAGLNAALLIEHRQSGVPIPESLEVRILDLKTMSITHRLQVGSLGSQVAFAGETAVAVARFPAPDATVKPQVQIWNIQSGRLTATFTDPEQGASTSVGISADGRILMAYTGKENFCEKCAAQYKYNLQIEDARFTLWDMQSHKPIAHSSSLLVTKSAPQLLDFLSLHPKECYRPTLQLSQSGNAVLVSHPGWSAPLEVFTRR